MIWNGKGHGKISCTDGSESSSGYCCWSLDLVKLGYALPRKEQERRKEGKKRERQGPWVGLRTKSPLHQQAMRKSLTKGSTWEVTKHVKFNSAIERTILGEKGRGLERRGSLERKKARLKEPKAEIMQGTESYTRLAIINSRTAAAERCFISSTTNTRFRVQ